MSLCAPPRVLRQPPRRRDRTRDVRARATVRSLLSHSCEIRLAHRQIEGSTPATWPGREARNQGPILGDLWAARTQRLVVEDVAQPRRALQVERTSLLCRTHAPLATSYAIFGLELERRRELVARSDVLLSHGRQVLIRTPVPPGLEESLRHLELLGRERVRREVPDRCPPSPPLEAAVDRPAACRRKLLLLVRQQGLRELLRVVLDARHDAIRARCISSPARSILPGWRKLPLRISSSGAGPTAVRRRLPSRIGSTGEGQPAVRRRLPSLRGLVVRLRVRLCQRCEVLLRLDRRLVQVRDHRGIAPETIHDGDEVLRRGDSAPLSPASRGCARAPT
eukprot:16448518-Heterocapsa_arctica.AAC.1